MPAVTIFCRLFCVSASMRLWPGRRNDVIELLEESGRQAAAVQAVQAMKAMLYH
jgi:hypothetical protein